MEGPSSLKFRKRMIAPAVATIVVVVATVLVVGVAVRTWIEVEGFSAHIQIAFRLLVTFLVPVVAISGFRLVVRQQNRHAHRAIEAKLEAEQQLSRAKDSLITDISGELRSPLTTIFGFSELLIEHGIVDPSEAMELVELINHDSAELARMVEDLVVASWLDDDAVAYEPVATDLLAELESVAAPFRRNGQVVNIRGRRVQVWADPIRVRQIARNVLSNAVNHGGPRIEVAVAVQDDNVLCTFADDGPGLPPEVELRMFDRLVHNGRQVLLTGTTGLGLAVARSLAVGMGGDLGYGRTLGWTSFLLRLPRAENVAATGPAMEASSAPRNGGSLGIGPDMADPFPEDAAASRASHLRALRRAFGAGTPPSR